MRHWWGKGRLGVGRRLERRESEGTAPTMRTHAPLTLGDEQRDQLRRLIASGAAPARTLTHARILLKAEAAPAGPGWTDVAIAAALEVSVETVARVRRRYPAAGLEAALWRRPPAAPTPCKLDGEQEAHLIALACSAPPDGQERRTLRLLAGRFVALDRGEPISHELVRCVLKTASSSPG